MCCITEKKKKKKSQAPEIKLHARDICISFVGKVNRPKCEVVLCDGRLSNAKPTLILNKSRMISACALSSREN